MSLENELKAIIRDVVDFPKEGIVFKDLQTKQTSLEDIFLLFSLFKQGICNFFL